MKNQVSSASTSNLGSYSDSKENLSTVDLYQKEQPRRGMSNMFRSVYKTAIGCVLAKSKDDGDSYALRSPSNSEDDLTPLVQTAPPQTTGKRRNSISVAVLSLARHRPELRKTIERGLKYRPQVDRRIQKNFAKSKFSTS